MVESTRKNARCPSRLLLATTAALVLLAPQEKSSSPVGAEALAQEPPRIADMLDQASRSSRYETPDTENLDRAQTLFEHILAGHHNLQSLRRAAEPLPFDLIVIRTDRDEVWVLRGKSHDLAGRGFYAFRRGTTQRLLLQAPHSFHDRNTREIVRLLFAESRVTAAAWNTIHRKSADLAHLPRTYLDPLTRAFLSAHPRGAIVQLHGFSPKRRKTSAAAKADMILSNGSKFPSHWTREVTQSFQREFAQSDVLLYPYDVRELGGTTNQQKNVVWEAGSDRFLHIELSPKLRRQLLEHPGIRRHFLNSLKDL